MRIALSVLVGVVLVAPSPVVGDERFTPRDGKFTIKFPGKPKESNQTTKSGIGDLKVYTATYATSDGNVYMVSYTDFPAAAIKPEHHDTLYVGVKEGLTGKDGKVVSEKDIKVGRDQLAGKEILIDKGKQQTRLRVVVKDNRLFQIATLGTGEFVTAKDANDFLDSFEPTK